MIHRWQQTVARAVPLALAVLTACAGTGGSSDSVDEPRPEVAKRPLPPVSEIASLTLSPVGSCAVFRSGRVLCWGTWDGALVKLPAPIVSLTEVAEVAVGWDGPTDPQEYREHICVRQRDGRGQCWGNNQQRQLGVDAAGETPRRRKSRASPTPGQLVLGGRHSCVLHDTATVSCWGANDEGQVGVGPGCQSVERPASVPNLTGVTKLIAMRSNTCALTSDARVWCWGYNWNGKADGTSGLDRRVVWYPIEIGDARGAAHIAAGRSALCAAKQDGAVFCWGLVSALLGDEAARTNQGTVPGLSDIRQVAVGDYHACGLDSRGGVVC